MATNIHRSPPVWQLIAAYAANAHLTQYVLIHEPNAPIRGTRFLFGECRRQFEALIDKRNFLIKGVFRNPKVEQNNHDHYDSQFLLMEYQRNFLHRGFDYCIVCGYRDVTHLPYVMFCRPSEVVHSAVTYRTELENHIEHYCNWFDMTHEQFEILLQEQH